MKATKNSKKIKKAHAKMENAYSKTFKRLD